MLCPWEGGQARGGDLIELPCPGEKGEGFDIWDLGQGFDNRLYSDYMVSGRGFWH